MARLVNAVNSIKTNLLEFKKPELMWKELAKAKNYGKKIGLFCLNIHSSLFYGTVDSLEVADAEKVVVFNWFNETNERCQSIIFLKEIEKICIAK